MTRERWSVKNIVKGRTLSLLILTTIFTIAFNKLVDKLLNAFIQRYSNSAYGIPVLSFHDYWYVLIVPSVILSIILIKLFLMLTGVNYSDEISLHPSELKRSFEKLVETTKKIITHRVTKYVIIIGLIIVAINFIIAFVQIGIVIVKTDSVPYRTIARIIPALLQLLIFLGLLYLMKMLELSSSTISMLKSSRYGIRLGLISLVLLITGFGVITCLVGFILSIYGVIKDNGKGRKAALYGVTSNGIVILVYAFLIYIYLQVFS